MLSAKGECRCLVSLVILGPDLAQLRYRAGSIEGAQAGGGMQEPVQARDVGVSDDDLRVGADSGVQVRVGEEGGEELCEGGPADGADYC